MAWDGCVRFESQPRRVTDRSGELLQPWGHESKDPVETWLAFSHGLPGHKAVCLFPWADIPLGEPGPGKVRRKQLLSGMSATQSRQSPLPTQQTALVKCF